MIIIRGAAFPLSSGLPPHSFRGKAPVLTARCIYSAVFPHHLLPASPWKNITVCCLCASMECLNQFVPKNTSIRYRFQSNKICQYPYGIFICPAPYWQGVCRADWLNLSIIRSRECFPLPARPPACCSGCPHRAEVSLWLPLGLPAMGSPAPDAARCLPSPVTVLRFTPQGGRQVMAKLLVRRNFIKGKPLKAAAYWYSVVKFPTFRRKAYGSNLLVL